MRDIAVKTSMIEEKVKKYVCILILESTGFADGLDVGCERKKWV